MVTYICQKKARMTHDLSLAELNNIIMIGDRMLIKPRNQQGKTKSGLYLPPNVQEKEQVQTGYIIKVGPGYPIPKFNDDDEPWKPKGDDVRYVPVQPKEGDLAVFLPHSGYEVQFNSVKYFIVPQSAVLMVMRDEGLMK